MTDFTFAPDPAQAPYNLAHLVDDRSHLYHEYDVDREFDAGCTDPRTGKDDAPPDYSERRAAMLAFYGHRCGRCACRIGDSTTPDLEVGYLYSLATATGRGEEWALANLVAVCEPCYDLLTTDCPEDIGAFGTQYENAPQFPVWTCDPRVAVERLPLTGREVWLREQLAGRVDVSTDGRTGVNQPVARDACLARTTDAAVAVALGEELVLDEQQACSTMQRRLSQRWELLTAHERDSYREQAVDEDTVIGGGFEPCVDLQDA
ncbi:hypothetical protein [Haloarchaeobius amylolyticus]|uniref:hypothetical protein n=1 Tax=Haloarchaeobius amylolyticus TaxID=1198296 RepID=UPI00226EEA84|nr:hypothetical protein [Haloarchaeobius amylolyticus]